MCHFSIIITLFITTLATLTTARSIFVDPPLDGSTPTPHNPVSFELFAELEELARIVDISYCVGTTGIAKPFLCASRCDEFPSFELVDTFNTGPLMSDSCGYIVLDHGRQRFGFGKRKGRVIVAFRGTYSIANTIVDLSTIPQEYVPYPDNSTTMFPPSRLQTKHHRWFDWIPRPWHTNEIAFSVKSSPTCQNCTVHSGFWTSWQNTRPFILPHLKRVHEIYPEYDLHLVGHSLGGAVAALAALELEGLGWKPTITTFGEPTVGNKGLRDFIDMTFDLLGEAENAGLRRRYRRVTHVEDPVPLLPLREWGFRPHAGEVYIEKYSLQPEVKDLRLCYGDEDVDCLSGDEADESWFMADDGSMVDIQTVMTEIDNARSEEEARERVEKRWGFPIPARYKMWQLFFAHRDYFWRLGLCVPGGDPLDWGRPHYNFTDVDKEGMEGEEL